jgi:hypothetical protein
MGDITAPVPGEQDAHFCAGRNLRAMKIHHSYQNPAREPYEHRFDVGMALPGPRPRAT